MINSKELDSYINYISHYKVDKNIVGAIVMNANPFTNGHRYLIEKALEEVEYLYVFVVESNRCSSYDYMEREWMVRKSTEDLKNVCILSGGSIFTSELSFPEYFNRSASKTEINPTLNNKIFGMRIAPALNITHRYFGEETIDNVTKALNEAASSELPNYGIQVHIVERLKIGQEPISAKNVRKYINYGNKEELRKLVPNCVLEKIIIS
uniref:adenylyltransferase/cytidyltransferase family protein n=2 Tax=Bacteroidales TaxID=171549 RepID=UPI003FED427F